MTMSLSLCFIILSELLWDELLMGFIKSRAGDKGD